MVNQKLYIPAQFPLHLVQYNARVTVDATPIRLLFSRSFFLSFVSKILKINLGQQLTPNSDGSVHCFTVENHCLRLGGAEPYPSRFPLDCKPPQCAEGYSLMKPTEPCNLQMNAILRFPNQTLSSHLSQWHVSEELCICDTRVGNLHIFRGQFSSSISDPV